MQTEKLATIALDSSAEPDVMAALDKLDIVHHTRFADVPGNGETGRKEGSPIFPGLNTMLLVVLPSEKVELMVRTLHEVRDSFLVSPGLKIIVTDCVMY